MKHFSTGNRMTVFGILMLALVVYTFVRMQMLSSQVARLNDNVAQLTAIFASTTAALQTAITETHTTLTSQLNAEQQNVGDLQQTLGGFQSQVGNLSGTISDIQKLSQLDPELLKKYSKVYFLNENYVPVHLSAIPLAYQYSDSKQMLLYTNVLPRLEAMIDDASSTNGIKLYVDSAYRSFAEQQALKGRYTVTYGAGTANSFSADQGYSEHQLGTAVDFITTGQGGQLDGFDQTAAFTWLQANAYKYGFILSYPKNNGYYVFEPWHWRFVGIKLATYLHDNNQNFYDLDQRTIDTYLISIFP